MQRMFTGLVVLLALCGAADARGVLVPIGRPPVQPPIDPKLPVPPPVVALPMISHDVKITIEDQVAVTNVEQVFRNNTDYPVEATYIFPVPSGASVRKFSMWSNGKEVKGEMVEADKAKQVYTQLVQQTKDPGLLEYIGNNMLQVKIHPIAPKAEQKISLSYTAVANLQEEGLVEYNYPLKADRNNGGALEKFAISINLKAQRPITNIYSPTHAVSMTRPNEREAVISFNKDEVSLDKDFQLYFNAGIKDVGLTTLVHRTAGDSGYFMMLVSPRAELAKEQEIPRDMVFVLDTSGSMKGQRIIQAKKALQYCLSQLNPKDRFAILHFNKEVHKYEDALKDVSVDNVKAARQWVEELKLGSGTNINDALLTAMTLRPEDKSRNFTVVFFTDGQATTGEKNPGTILNNVMAKNSGNTRFFTFGVGNDVNATLLDQLAEKTRAVSTYVREGEDIEARVSGLYAKISNPVLTDLQLAVSDGVKINEVYPPQLPDLFHGTQLVVLGRLTGNGKATVKLTGKVGKHAKEYVYEINVPEKTTESKEFVEDLWARRKVGYMLDQIRINGEKKELIEEIVVLAKRYGITTPYTSYLVTPSTAVAGQGGFGGGKGGAAGAMAPAALRPGVSGAPQAKVADFAKDIKTGEKGKGLDANRARLEEEESKKRQPGVDGKADKAVAEAAAQKSAFDQAREALERRQLSAVQNGALGVNLSYQVNNLRNQDRLTQCVTRRVADRTLLEVGGLWIDETFDGKMKLVTVKAQSTAYFRLLERQPNLRDLFRLGNHLVFVTPSGEALVIDTTDGVETLPDADIDRLFTAAAKKK